MIRMPTFLGGQSKEPEDRSRSICSSNTHRAACLARIRNERMGPCSVCRFVSRDRAVSSSAKDAKMCRCAERPRTQIVRLENQQDDPRHLAQQLHQLLQQSFTQRLAYSGVAPPRLAACPVTSFGNDGVIASGDG
ncbi:hypothetical protein MRB53_038616 [Persea americana]|nr:hypothetical protein MRB53_038616 [Persea americana]